MRFKNVLKVLLFAGLGVACYFAYSHLYEQMQKEFAHFNLPAEGGQSAPRTPQLKLAGFNPGNLISDAEFFNADAMSESQVRTFIQEWNKGCVGNGDVPCLADFSVRVDPRPASQYCPYPLAGGYLDAAGVIYQVSQACQVNPQVLLVTLQKEQGLLTASGRKLTSERYQIAMGYGCPDSAKCDEQFYGFENQVYGAAQQFQRYRLRPQLYAVKAEQENLLYFHPDRACGSRPVWVENQATAGLYNYTPYQPSDLTLSGVSEACSTWGNLNFYGLYQAWFKP
ncbi:hemagglutinin [Gleimia sp. 6138-11-ORH1]|uniref:hemagglutinin n=1 Tax=Gleimia sp. 6138-11-ORH1 TaxID=2973937 RepID=UPI002167729A|nr:hemagglutinin [Gleimia sp. 6138-11-ORH1]MCS4484814.1 hemagglutinin [Gleimia sp. 6138-11-ORH1]